MGVGLGVDACRRPAQSAHGALLAHRSSDVLQQGTDIGALGAADREDVLVLRRAAAVPDVQYLDGAGLPLHGHALAGQLIEGLAVELDCRIHGRRLHLRAEEPGQHRQQLGLPRRHRGRFQHGAGDVAGVGAQPQLQPGAVGLGVVELKVHSLAGPAAEHRQNAGGHGVQRTAVAQLAGAEDAAQLGDDVKAGPLHRLIYDKDALHQLSSCVSGRSSSASTSARMALLALSRLPSSSQPAARVWPPPPRRRAMAQASTPLAARTLMR